MNYDFVRSVNPVTNEVYWEASTSSTLVSVENDAVNNINSTPYYRCMVKLETVSGEEKLSSAIIYKANFDHGMEVGKVYLTTIRINPGDTRGPLISVSHLTPRPKASAADFGFTVPEGATTVTPKATEPVTNPAGEFAL